MDAPSDAPARRRARLVRRPRARPALARADASAVVGDGQRVHAAADPGGPGAAGPRRLARALADPGRAGRPRPTGEAVRMWGRLGYPRRALRLHAAADGHRRAPRRRGAGVVRRPARAARGRRLHRRGDRQLRLRSAARRARHQRAPGAGARGLRASSSRAPAVTRAERDLATSLLPDDAADGRHVGGGRRWSSARWCAPPASRRCDACPIAAACAWRGAGFPAYDGPPRRGQAWAGTDRQCRGRILALLREAEARSAPRRLDAVWLGRGPARALPGAWCRRPRRRRAR